MVFPLVPDLIASQPAIHFQAESAKIESPYAGRDFVQFGKTKSTPDKKANEKACLLI